MKLDFNPPERILDIQAKDGHQNQGRSFLQMPPLYFQESPDDDQSQGMDYRALYQVGTESGQMDIHDLPKDPFHERGANRVNYPDEAGNTPL